LKAQSIDKAHGLVTNLQAQAKSSLCFLSGTFGGESSGLFVKLNSPRSKLGETPGRVNPTYDAQIILSPMQDIYL
jgi:hypothetical protein